jgi:hypothetical protein
MEVRRWAEEVSILNLPYAFGTSPALKEAEDIAAILRSDGATLWGTAPMEVVWKAGFCMLPFWSMPTPLRLTGGRPRPCKTLYGR